MCTASEIFNAPAALDRYIRSQFADTALSNTTGNCPFPLHTNERLSLLASSCRHHHNNFLKRTNMDQACAPRSPPRLCVRRLRCMMSSRANSKAAGSKILGDVISRKEETMFTCRLVHGLVSTDYLM
jgi:hypothetical protein